MEKTEKWGDAEMEISLMEEAITVDEDFDEGSDYYDVFRPVILNIPREILREHMNRTCLAILEFIAWHGTKIDRKTGELVIRPLIISQAFLCRRFGLSRDWISKMTKRLEDLGYIRVYRRKDAQGRYLANVYVVSEHILNKSLLRILKNGRMKDECEKLMNLNTTSWILAVPKGITDIPVPPHMRNEDTFREFFKAIYLRVKDGKLNYEDFINLLMELFEIKKKYQQSEEIYEEDIPLDDFPYDDSLIAEGKEEDIKNFIYEIFQDALPPEDEYEDWEDSSSQEDDDPFDLKGNVLREDMDYLVSGFYETEEELKKRDIPEDHIFIKRFQNGTEKDGNELCPLRKIFGLYRDLLGKKIAFYCQHGSERYICICGPEKEIRKAVFRSKELVPLKILHAYIRSRNYPVLTDLEVARAFHISKRRARFLLYLLGAEVYWSDINEPVRRYATYSVEDPRSARFTFEWVFLSSYLPAINSIIFQEDQPEKTVRPAAGIEDPYFSSLIM